MITFLKSFLIGICAILPGVSGSVIAISLGIYDKFIYSLSSINNIKDNYKFIIVVFIGTIIGMILASNLILYFFRFRILLNYIFTGIILSELPFLIKKIHRHSGKRIMLMPLLFSFLISLLLNKMNTITIFADSKLCFFIGGILFSFGKIFPGISSSFFLLSLGIYENIIILLTKPLMLIYEFNIYFPFIIGTFIGIIIFYKLLIKFMETKYELTYSIIVGFIISSVFVLIPSISLNINTLVGILLMILFFTLPVYIKTKNDS